MNELLLICMVAGKRTAIPASQVQSVIEIDAITPIPGTDPYICGLTALRSQALTVIDCPPAIGLGGTSFKPGARAAVVQIEEHLYALLVDEAFDVEEARSEAIAVQGGFGAGWQRVATGMVETDGGPAVLLDIETLIAGPDAEAA